MRTPLAVLALVLVTLALAPAARATTLEQLQGSGFQIVRSSTVAGPFTGCEKSQAWALADGTTFICNEAWHVERDGPKAILLRNQIEHTYVLLIGGHTYDATLIQLGDRPLGTPSPLISPPPPPLSRTALSRTPLADPPPRSPLLRPSNDRIGPVGDVGSINQLRVLDGLRLTEAQQHRPLAPPRSR